MQKGVLSSFSLKLIMAFLMLLDHLYFFFPNIAPLWFTCLGRIVAPTFTFLMAQGMVHTKNAANYIGRIFCFSLVMQLGNIALAYYFGKPLFLNIFLSLAISAAIIFSIEKIIKKQKQGLYIVLLLILIMMTPFCEGGFLCPVMAVIFYFLRNNTLLMLIAFSVASVFMVLLLGFQTIQMLMVFAFIPILLYNGKRGINNPFSKYFFYLFYPIHIWILFVLSSV